MQNLQLTHSQLTRYENELFRKGIIHVAGIDEVGRGALAGPMVSAAVILDIPKMFELGVIVDQVFRNNDVSSPEITQEKAWYLEINDSKKISPKKRERLSALILENALSYTFEVIENTEVDEWGISKATQVSFFNSIKHLKITPQHILTDSFKINAMSENMQTNIVRGDSLSITIAAASIIAKVYRDNLMQKYHLENENYKMYGFDKHKGYGTKEHIDAIRTHGISPLHRRTFCHL